MNIIPPAWFDVPGFTWEELPKNARIAARWVHAGLKVFPCYHRVYEDSWGNIHEVKTPKTPNGFKDAFDDLHAALVCWTENPEDLVGVSCEDQLLVIDIDMDSEKDEPVDGWASLHDAGLSVPEGFMIVTPRGGNHSYCRPPAGVTANSVKNLRLEDGTVLHGVDRRARGGYVIGWAEEGIPESIDDLPFAPMEYCHVCSGGGQGVEYSKSVDEWLETIGAGEPKGPMKKAKEDIPLGDFGHQEMCGLQRHIVGLAAQGHPGGASVLDALRAEYLRPPYDTLRWEADYNAALAGAIKKFGGSADSPGSSSQQSHSVAAVAIADAKYDFYPTTDDDVLAVPKDGPKVSVSISAGKDFYSQLSVDFYDAHDGTKALSDKAFKEAVGIISGRVRKLPKIDAHLRVAEIGEETFLDLGDETGRCVRITADGWTVEEESPVLFRRTNLVAPLPVPERGSDLKEFFNLINIPERSKALYLGFLVSFYFPNIAHPILAPLGPQGSGKSKASEHTHRILDNSPILGRKLAKNIEEWVVAGGASYLINLDNVSKLSEDMSDALCRAVTGDAAVPRTLYMNKKVEVIKFRRVLILNGIDILGIREDLADRLLVLEMQAIKPEQRLTESSMDSAAESMGPGVFGALLDVVVLVKQTLPHVHLDRLPRMADFAKILRALEIIYPGLSALEEYELSIEEAAMNAIQQNPVLTAMAEIITEPWEGTSKEMLDLLNKKKPLLDESRKYWPNTPALMTTILARSGPAFTKIGWTVEDLGSRNKKKTKQWRLTPPEPWTKMENPGTFDGQWGVHKF
jgi:hypothetical protein